MTKQAAVRRTRVTVATVALAGTGLVVSLVAGAASAWPRLAPGPLVPEAAPGPAAVAGQPPSSVAGRPHQDRRLDRSRNPQRPQGTRARPAGVRTEVRPSRPAPPPLRLSLPAAGIDLPIRPVGVAEDGQMELPADPAVLGWYRYGPAPAEPGSAVLAAHVDSWEHGIGPLARLSDVAVGDLLMVRTAQGTVPHTVTAVERYAKQALPASVFARTGAPRLRLITCGGEFDEAAGHYRENLVVTAQPRG